jgi:RNA-splicing ligase RtcB
MDLKIYASTIEETALNQIDQLFHHPAFCNQKVRIMPDVHAGAGCVIGFTSTFKDIVVPNIIGVDIGCGVTAMPILKSNRGPKWFEEFDSFLREVVPSGFNIRAKETEHLNSYGAYEFKIRVMNACMNTGQDYSRVFKSIGTLGGGNHFIEIDKDKVTGKLYLVVHSGSRNFGWKIAKFYQEKAKEMTEKGSVTPGLEYLQGEWMCKYIEDMKVAQDMAKLNRKVILDYLSDYFGISGLGGFFSNDSQGMIESVHNYINFDDLIVRKGAISAHVGEKVIIPFNMRDGIIIGTGLGNSEWNCSAPHGAGRIMGRNAAKKALSLDDFKKSMEGIWSSTVCAETLDEAPMVYKSKEEVLGLIGETVKVEQWLEPIYNFKASE